MGLFGKRSRAEDWTPVQIHIVTAKRFHGNSEGGLSSGINAAIELVTEHGGTDYRFVLRVTPPGGNPYEVAHREKVRDGDTKIPDGIDLPGWARIDDPSVVAIDWSGYGASPEAKAAIADATQFEVDHKYAQQVLAKQKPAMQQKMRDGAWQGTLSNAEAVRLGSLSFEDWDAQAQANVRKTLITPEQYEQARAATTHSPER